MTMSLLIPRFPRQPKFCHSHAPSSSNRQHRFENLKDGPELRSVGGRPECRWLPMILDLKGALLVLLVGNQEPKT